MKIKIISWGIILLAIFVISFTFLILRIRGMEIWFGNLDSAYTLREVGGREEIIFAPPVWTYIVYYLSNIIGMIIPPVILTIIIVRKKKYK